MIFRGTKHEDGEESSATSSEPGFGRGKSGDAVLVDDLCVYSVHKLECLHEDRVQEEIKGEFKAEKLVAGLKLA
jgi:hypothetical protein